MIRDVDDGKVRLAHHTVQQYLISPQASVSSTGFEDVTHRAHFWPELQKLRLDSKSAEVTAGRLCVSYLCFSDFGTAVSCRNDEKKIDLATAFEDRGLISIPAAINLGKHLHSIPYKFFGGQNKFKMPDVDYSKYLNVKPTTISRIQK